MPLSYKDLTEDVRLLMLDELATDVADDKLYRSVRLNEDGKSRWEQLLRNAISSGDDSVLARHLRLENLLVTREARRNRGRVSWVSVPYTAADTLAEGEFNRGLQEFEWATFMG